MAVVGSSVEAVSCPDVEIKGAVVVVAWVAPGGVLAVVAAVSQRYHAWLKLYTCSASERATTDKKGRELWTEITLHGNKQQFCIIAVPCLAYI